jgi:Protein of unknown function (DUF3551)
MKLSVIALGSLGLWLSLASTPASAAEAKKYCLNPASGGSSCGYTSLEQCQETMRGRNGWCTEQVDFSKWGPSYGQPENSFAYDPPGGKLKQRRMSQDERDIQNVYKKDMPSKGVGAE